MLRDKIDHIGYSYLGRKYLYLNIVIDVLSFIKSQVVDISRQQLKDKTIRKTLIVLKPKAVVENSSLTDGAREHI